MTIFFSSDSHFSHANIIKYCNRPYKDIDEMNNALVDNWNSVVSVDDTVYFLGDFSLNIQALEFGPLLNGKKIFISGNHDRCWDHFKPKRRVSGQLYIDAGFTEVHTSGELYINLPILGDVLLSHLPATGDSHSDEDRYANLRPTFNGLILCGHVHDEWKHKDNNVNVGVDVWNYKPVSIHEICAYVEFRGVDTPPPRMVDS